MPYFRRAGHPVVSHKPSFTLWGPPLQEAFLDLPILMVEDLYDVAMARTSIAGKALPLSWFVGLALVLRQIEAAGRWPQGLLDAYIAMIPEAEGDSTSLGQRPSCVLPVVYRLWASIRPARIQDWFHSWVHSSVDAWCATTVDIEEVLSNTRQGDFHLLDRDILDCALRRLGLPAWLRKVYFSFHREARLRFKLAAGFGG